MPLGMLGLLLIPLGLADLVLRADGAGDRDHHRGRGVRRRAARRGAGRARSRRSRRCSRPWSAGSGSASGAPPWRRLGLIGHRARLRPDACWPRPPDLLVDARGQIVAVRLDDGRLALSPWKRDSWITDSWLQSAGQDEAAPWPADGPAMARTCAAMRSAASSAAAASAIALARRPEALEEDCALRRPGDQLSAHRALPERHAADRPAARCAARAASPSGSSAAASRP